MKKIVKQKYYLGFTLIELLVVMTIIAVLAAIGLVNFTTASKSARDSRRKTDLETVRQALVLYKVQNNFYPPGINDAGSYTSLVSGSYLTSASGAYLSSPTPVDPRNPTNNGSLPYFYSYDRPTATTFCLCADVENTASGNSASRSCGSLTTSGEYYCVRQP
jgi:general secretion pathway protein G